jgi:hypothetical protein
MRQEMRAGVPGVTGVEIKSVFVSTVSENQVLVKVAAGPALRAHHTASDSPPGS